MGRATVNDLLDFFISKYGGEETLAFQFVHNGNIMIDGEEHIAHIGKFYLSKSTTSGIELDPRSEFLFDIDEFFILRLLIYLLTSFLSSIYVAE
jgi:hypothetical protein